LAIVPEVRYRTHANISARHAPRIGRILDLLEAAARPGDLDIPGLGLHPLKGERKGEWALSVSGNWRITFRFEGEDVVDVSIEDYH
jgi:proteic killer suppression protein